MTATIRNTIKTIDGTPISGAQIYITFIPGNDQAAFEASTLAEYPTSTITTTTDTNGLWSITLKSNGDFPLDNTYYKVQEVISPTKTNEYDIIVPTGGGTYFLHDVIATPVGTGPTFNTSYLTAAQIAALYGIKNYTTANRPSPVGNQGLQIYDITINRPIWSDGTVWRNAAGTAV